MTDSVRFHFDPLCPWCYQTSRWVQRLVELDEISVEWAVFSLEIVNAGSAESAQKDHARSESSLRTVIAVRDAEGADAVGRFYAALGAAVHQRGEAVEDHATITAALIEANLPAALLDKALADDSTWTAVQDEHRALVEGTRSFGVPTIVLDGGNGPAIFGPVISNPPTDADAVELWRHIAWLTRYENLSELKRERTIQPDLPSFQR